jgi:hypothetical protein
VAEIVPARVKVAEYDKVGVTVVEGAIVDDALPWMVMDCEGVLTFERVVDGENDFVGEAWGDTVGLGEPVCTRDGDSVDVVAMVRVEDAETELVTEAVGLRDTVATPERLRVLDRDFEDMTERVRVAEILTETETVVATEPVGMWDLDMVVDGAREPLFEREDDTVPLAFRESVLVDEAAREGVTDPPNVREWVRDKDRVLDGARELLTVPEGAIEVEIVEDAATEDVMVLERVWELARDLVREAEMLSEAKGGREGDEETENLPVGLCEPLNVVDGVLVDEKLAEGVLVEVILAEALRERVRVLLKEMADVTESDVAGVAATEDESDAERERDPATEYVREAV